MAEDTILAELNQLTRATDSMRTSWESIQDDIGTKCDKAGGCGVFDSSGFNDEGLKLIVQLANKTHQEQHKSTQRALSNIEYGINQDIPEASARVREKFEEVVRLATERIDEVGQREKELGGQLEAKLVKIKDLEADKDELLANNDEQFEQIMQADQIRKEAVAKAKAEQRKEAEEEIVGDLGVLLELQREEMNLVGVKNGIRNALVERSRGEIFNDEKTQTQAANERADAAEKALAAANKDLDWYGGFKDFCQKQDSLEINDCIQDTVLGQAAIKLAEAEANLTQAEAKTAEAEAQREQQGQEAESQRQRAESQRQEAEAELKADALAKKVVLERQNASALAELAVKSTELEAERVKSEQLASAQGGQQTKFIELQRELENAQTELAGAKTESAERLNDIRQLGASLKTSNTNIGVLKQKKEALEKAEKERVQELETKKRMSALQKYKSVVDPINFETIVQFTEAGDKRKTFETISDAVNDFCGEVLTEAKKRNPRLTSACNPGDKKILKDSISDQLRNRREEAVFVRGREDFKYYYGYETRAAPLQES